MGACLEIGHQELLGIDMIDQEGLKQGECRGGQGAAPDRAAAVVIFSSDDRVSQTSFCFVVIHGDMWMIDKQGQPLPVMSQAFEDLAFGQVQGGRGEKIVSLPGHDAQGIPQGRIFYAEGFPTGTGLKPLVIEVEEVIDAFNPILGPHTASHILSTEADEVPSYMDPTVGTLDLLPQSLISCIPVHTKNALGAAEVVDGDRSRACRLQQVAAGICRHHHPEPPAMPPFSCDLGKHHPSRLVHMPVMSRSAMFQDPHIEGLEESPDTLEPSSQGSLGYRQALDCQHLPHPVQLSFIQKLLQEQPRPEHDGEHTLGNQLSRGWGGDDAGDSVTATGGGIAGALVDPPDEMNLPANLLGILGSRKDFQRPAALRTRLHGLRQIVEHLFGGQILTPSTPMPLLSRLFTPASPWPRGLHHSPSAVPFSSRLISALLSFSAKDLLPKPDHLGLQRFDHRCQLLDLSGLLPHHPFEMKGLVLPKCLALCSLGVQGLPVMGLLAVGDKFFLSLREKATTHTLHDTQRWAVCPEKNYGTGNYRLGRLWVH